ncbi:phytanoyl-CoA dioxygenase family protein [Bacillus sp. FSL K6-3431]|uniref:phytanoyl-CoA dioxygenase family protein n=1 Tax=Bacillus sp. FSL K6-3431 TaxID=2921500 RepID=UPI0030F7D95C
MKVQMGKHELEMNSEYLTELRSSNDILDDSDALRKRLNEDGYLLIRNFHDRKKVLEARYNILEKLQQMGRLDPNAPLEAGVIGPEGKGAAFMGFSEKLTKEIPDVVELSESDRVMKFFDRLLGGESLTYDFKWPRAVSNGGNTGAHYDNVYMGRGTRDLYTCWTPLGDVSLEMGPLVVCLGSQNFEKVKNTYGEMDVDRDNVEGGGWLSDDPYEIVEKFGGKWATTSFNAGDAIIFGMFFLHGSLNNTTNQYRLSMDTRYQLKSEPVDERWFGKDAKGHYAWGKDKGKTISEARKEWGI